MRLAHNSPVLRKNYVLLEKTGVAEASMMAVDWACSTVDSRVDGPSQASFRFF